MHDRYGDPIEPEPDDPEPVEEPPPVELQEPPMADRALAVAHCELCDDDGYRGCSVCDHVDYRPAARRGMAAVRAALERGGS